jgi:DNA-binding response OmpR family regulator
VVIVDLMLNDMDGLSLIEELREQYRGLHIIAVMNKESLELVNLTADNITLMAAQSGANAVFIAPFNLAELVATVERFINDIASIH